MGEHASALTLDSLAADLPVDLPTSSHVATCGVCRAKLEELKTERAALMQTPRFNALLEKLQPPVQKKTMPRWAPVVLALAAALLLIVGTRFLPADDGTLLKGQQTIELLKDGASPVTRARVGDKLSLAVGGAGQKAVAAFAVDEKGEVALLLPSTPIAAGARVTVGSVLEVTPGSLVVFGCFGDHPLPVDTLRAEIFSRLGKTPLEAAAPPGCVKTKLEVLP